MNKKLLMGGLAGVAAIALAVGGTTFSAWSDFGSITGNNAGAGVLKLTVNPNQPADAVFDQVKMAPGGINEVRNVYVASNSGDSTPNAQLFLSFTNVHGIEDGCDGNAEVADDSACIHPTTTTDPSITADPANQGQFVRDAIVQVTSYAVNSPGECNESYAPSNKVVTGQHGGSLSWWASQVPYQVTGDGTALGGVNESVLTPGEGMCVSATISLAHSVNNASQGDSASFDLRFDLVQP